MSYYIAKRYRFTMDDTGRCAPVWVKAPHWNPLRFETWQQAADAYIAVRLGNLRVPGISGYPPADVTIVFEPDH